MANTLYICVDECGLPTVDGFFSVAACWGLSETGPRPTLNETRRNLLDLLTDLGEISGDPTELKGKDISAQGMDEVFKNLTSFAHQDNTICSPPYPWTDRPVRFTTTGIDAEVARKAFSHFERDLETPKLVQTMSLINVLSPILYQNNLDIQQYDRVRIILDGEVWNPAKEAMQTADRVDNYEFRTMDSHKVPGIQLADIAARVRRMSQLGTEYDTAESKLDDLELE